MIIRIGVEQVIRLYEDHIHAGKLRDRGLLEGAIAAPFQHVFGREQFPSLAQKAGKLLDGVQRVQAYTDGNKRLAWVAVNTFLHLNDQVIVDIPADEVNAFVRGLVGDPQAAVTAAVWLNQRMRGLL